MLRRAPVTTQLAIPYGILILPQALLYGNEHIAFIVGILGLALAGCAPVEVLLRTRRRDELLVASRERLESYGGILRVVALLACAAGQASGIVSASFGVGTVAAQLGLIRPLTPVGPLLSIFSTWTVSGAALLVAAHLAGQLTRRTLNLCFLIVITLEGVRTAITTITASLISLTVYLVILGIFAGTLRLRTCVLAVVAVLLIWPSVYELRNAIRQESGVHVSASVDAFDRLRYDQQISRAADIVDIPIDIGQPDLPDTLRYGLIPRFLDPDRPTLSTGNRINVFLGGTQTSSFTFLPVTTLYVLQGPLATVAFYAVLAIILAIALRSGSRLTPWRLIVFGLVSAGPLSWFAGYPDSTIGCIQGLVAALPLLAVLHLARRRRMLPSPDAPRRWTRGRSVRDPVAPPDRRRGLPEDHQVEPDRPAA
ncbi:hypothetical protein [Nakamurella sp.]|uniref:hypothetical protein n=1 Tax=Nakamurella sp. TaxID=1869182 RepID=UPI003B3AA39A